ncbi:TPA: DUF551 domain-containing protein [Escherichia coli]|uniref:DUF551 domain-containing protein n=1 Tax=Escherichia coli TaxID=562 RepID=UPI001F3CAFA1|nr:DUF551 domain-containing protein [Escherichia coli]HCX7793446.1 DUF551 domain-containing protein [Escherichia coli]
MTTITKEWLQKTITSIESARDEIPFGLDEDQSNMLTAFKIALVSLEAKPIGAFHIAEQQVDGTSDYIKDGEWPIDNGTIEVYAAPPVPVVPEEKPMPNPLSMYAVDAVAAIAEVGGWNACRAAMLQSQGNCIKDGWISCSERMPEKNQNVLISVNFDSSLVEPLICSARYTGSTFRRGDATIKPGNGIEQATHWMPLPEPPQESKSE